MNCKYKKGLLSSSLSTENDSNPITSIILLNKNYVNSIKDDVSIKDGKLKTYYRGTQRDDRVILLY